MSSETEGDKGGGAIEQMQIKRDKESLFLYVFVYKFAHWLSEDS